MNVWRVVIIAAAAALLGVLGPYVHRSAEPRRQRAALVKAASAVRMLASATIVLLLLWELVERTGTWALPVRWAIWSAALVLALVWVGNVLAGLWVLLPFVGAEPGALVVASGHRGKIVGYGSSRLELSTRNGWSVHVPYLRLVYEPLLVRARDRPRRVELEFQRARWSEEQLASLRQAALLSPYRDLTSPVGVTRQADVVTVHIGLCHPGAQTQLRHFLEHVISELGTAAAGSTQLDGARSAVGAAAAPTAGS